MNMLKIFKKIIFSLKNNKPGFYFANLYVVCFLWFLTFPKNVQTCCFVGSKTVIKLGTIKKHSNLETDKKFKTFPHQKVTF